MNIRSFVWKYSTKKNERNAVKYSDFCIFLNERDKNEIEDYYGPSKNSSIIPITMKDTFDGVLTQNSDNYGLFVGSFYKPNLEAIDFINSISNKLSCKIKIVGYKLENYVVKDLSTNTELIGNVDDLSLYYKDASFVIMPIFSGSGMKVKTCEALMNGKVIFATREAIEGYKKTNDVYECNDSKSFINQINSYLENIKTFSIINRKLFLDNYSNEIAYDKFKYISEILNYSMT